jgi:hypothetical protein
MEMTADQLSKVMLRHARGEDGVAPPEEIFSRIRTAVAATPAPKISTRSRITVAVAGVPFVAAVVLLVASKLCSRPSVLRMDMATHPTSDLLIVLVLVIGLTLSATLIAVGRGERGLGSGAMSLLLVALLVAPIYAVLTVVHPLAVNEAAALTKVSPWAPRCATVAATVALLVLISFTAALRRSVPAASRLRGAALGAAAGAWAGLAVFIFCPATEYHHLLVGHVLPVVAFTLVGLAATPRALRS